MVVPTAEGEVDVYLPKSGFLGSNGYLGWSVEIDDDGVVYIVKSEDYVYGRFPNARRTTPKKERMMAIEPDGVGRWKITLNLLRQDRVKPAPATYNALFGRWYWGTVSE